MEEELVNLNLANKEVPIQFQVDLEAVEEDYSLCLVGRVLPDSVVHFPSTRRTLVDL